MEQGSPTPMGGNPSPAPAAAPAPTPMPVAATPAPLPAPAPESMASGGATGGGGGIRDFFSDVNLVDIAISAFIVAGVLYSIHYFKFMMTLEKTGYSDLSSRMGKLESAVTAQQAELNATGGMNGKRRRPVMRLG
jgi:hypothetical protein